MTKRALGVAVKKPRNPKQPSRGSFVPARDRGTFIQRSRSVSSEEKAIYHNITGVGKSRVKRPFFNLNDSEQQELMDKLGELLELRLKSA